MSIIYDALKKVEGKIKNYGNAAQEAGKEQKAKAGPKIYLIYLLIIAFGAFSANFIYRLFTPSLKTAPAAKSIKAPETKEPAKEHLPELPQKPIALPEAASIEPPPDSEPLPSLILSGIFFSEDGAYALINNQIVEEGDEVGGLSVIKIGVTEVELQNKEKTLKLPIEPR